MEKHMFLTDLPEKKKGKQNKGLFTFPAVWEAGRHSRGFLGPVRFIWSR